MKPVVALTRDVAGFASIVESTKNGRDCVIACEDIKVSITFSFPHGSSAATLWRPPESLETTSAELQLNLAISFSLPSDAAVRHMALCAVSASASVYGIEWSPAAIPLCLWLGMSRPVDLREGAPDAHSSEEC